MNREILFRGKHIHALPQNERLDGTWVYGYLCDEDYINSPELEGELLVAPETVGQYTGKEDINKKQIYEGDIIKEISNGYTGIIKIGEYNNSDLGDKFLGLYVEWISKDAKLYKQNLWFWLNKIGIEVIGNIFDNPELLSQ